MKRIILVICITFAITVHSFADEIKTLGTWIDTSDFGIGQITIQKTQNDYLASQKFPDNSHSTRKLKAIKKNNIVGGFNLQVQHPQS
jgi:hypothetical protein